MQQVLRYLAALTVLVMVGATVATVDAAPGKSISGFVSGHGKGKGNGNGGGNGHSNGNGNGQGNGQTDDEDDHDKKDKKDKSSKSKHDDGADDEDEDNDRKVMVCHVTGSESHPGHVIKVSKKALSAHEAHGDEVVESEKECDALLSGTPMASPDASPEASPEASPAASPIAEDDDHKVTVCHRTGSASHPGHVIEVSKNAWPAHEAHGDEIVESEEECDAFLSGTPAASPDTSPEASPSAGPTEAEGTPAASPDASPVASPVADDEEEDDQESVDLLWNQAGHMRVAS